MSDIQSWHLRCGGNPTFKDRRLTIEHFLLNLANGVTIDEYCEDYIIEKEAVQKALRYMAGHIKDWMRPKQVWELWESNNEQSQTFAPSEKITDMFDTGLMPTDAKMIWTIVADSLIEANTKYHEYMGWEPYKPMLDENGHPYPEDAGDTF